MAEWSNWQDIYMIDDLKILYDCSGVYRIRLTDQQGDAIKIGRLIGVDKNGLLAIGESSNLSRRIRQFYRAYAGQSFTHSVAERLFLLMFKRVNSNAMLKNSKIKFSCMKLKDKAEAQVYEEKLLKKYFKEFGELPPLNSTLPDKNIDWREI